VGRIVLVVVGVSGGVLIGIAAFALLDDPQSVVGPGRPVAVPFPAVEHDEAAAAGLLTAWERWRSSTFYSRGTWERRLDAGDSPLRGPVLTVQDPPRRVVVRMGSLVELIDGSIRSCDSDIDGTIAPSCVSAEAEQSYAERVAAEMAVVEAYVLGSNRPFDIGPGGSDGCFRAENRALLPAAPWGLWAEFCFDDETGAMESARVRRDSAVDTEIMIEIRADVSDADFVLG
jgi:hypothetical protein